MSVRLLKSTPACSRRTTGLLTQSTRMVRCSPRITRWVFSCSLDGTAFEEPRMITFGIGNSLLQLWRKDELNQTGRYINLDERRDGEQRQDNSHEDPAPVCQRKQQGFSETFIGLRCDQLGSHFQHGR